MRDYTQAPVEVRHARLTGILDDITNEIVFVVGNEDAHEAITDLLEEARDIVRSLQASPSELTLTAE